MSLFSKQQYIWLASFFRDELNIAKNQDKNFGISFDETCEEYLKDLILRLGKELEQTNQGFDRARFEKAIYLDLEKSNTN